MRFYQMRLLRLCMLESLSACSQSNRAFHIIIIFFTIIIIIIIIIVVVVVSVFM